MAKTEHEKFEEKERERRGKEPDEDDLRHNYVARTAAARNEADKLGEPAMKKATRVWEPAEEKPLDPPGVAQITEGKAKRKVRRKSRS